MNLALVNAFDGSAGGTAEEHGPRDAFGCAANCAEAIGLGVDIVGAGVVAIHLGEDRPPLFSQQLDKFVEQSIIAQGQGAGQDQGRCITMPVQVADAIGHHTQHPAGALEAGDRGPVRIETVKDLRVNRVAGLHAFKVALFRHPWGIVAAVVYSGERFAGAVPLYLVLDGVEQPAPYYLKGFVDL